MGSNGRSKPATSSMRARFKTGSSILWSSARRALTPFFFRSPFAARRAPIGRRSWKPTALAVALAASTERRLETTAQGAAFVAAARAAWDCEPLRRLDEAPDEAASLIRSRSPQRRAGTACRSKPASRRSPSPRPPISSPPSCASGRSDRRTARRFSPRYCRIFGHWRARPSAPASPISAARPFVPTSPPCVTKASIRGCSGHDAQPALTRPPPMGRRVGRGRQRTSASGSNVI